MEPQLAHSIDTDQQALALLANDDWFAEQKADGKRIMVAIHGNELITTNRKGQPVYLDDRVAEAFEQFEGEWLFDGELMGDGVFWVFDMPIAMQEVQMSTPYSLRRTVLEAFWPSAFGDAQFVKLLPSAKETQEKLELARAITNHKGEGLMLKEANAPYVPGKRSRQVLKWKFVKTVDAIVNSVGAGGLRSCTVELVDAETSELIDVGSVTISDKWLNSLHRGDVVEVKYLYCVNPDKPRLYQPSILKLRDDKSPDECFTNQLVFTDRSIYEGDENAEASG